MSRRGFISVSVHKRHDCANVLGNERSTKRAKTTNVLDRFSIQPFFVLPSHDRGRLRLFTCNAIYVVSSMCVQKPPKATEMDVGIIEYEFTPRHKTDTCSFCANTCGACIRTSANTGKYFWELFLKYVFALWPCPLYWYSACIRTSLVPIHKNISGELISVQIHAAHVLTPGRIQENIPGELFMYWFRARGYSMRSKHTKQRDWHQTKNKSWKMVEN